MAGRAPRGTQAGMCVDHREGACRMWRHKAEALHTSVVSTPDHRGTEKDDMKMRMYKQTSFTDLSHYCSCAGGTSARVT